MLERIKAEMYLIDYQNLSPEDQKTIDIKVIEPEEYDYSGDEQWLALKKKYDITPEQITKYKNLTKTK